MRPGKYSIQLTNSIFSSSGLRQHAIPILESRQLAQQHPHSMYRPDGSAMKKSLSDWPVPLDTYPFLDLASVSVDHACVFVLHWSGNA